MTGNLMMSHYEQASRQLGRHLVFLAAYKHGKEKVRKSLEVSSCKSFEACELQHVVMIPAVSMIRLAGSVFSKHELNMNDCLGARW
jgi:hypothetical protein